MDVGMRWVMRMVNEGRASDLEEGKENDEHEHG